MSATTSLADTHQSSNYQQGRLLLLIAGRRLWSPSGQTSVRPQRRRTLRFLRKAFWTHHAAPARSPLVARPWADTVPSLCSGLPLSQWHSSVLPRRQHLGVADVEGRRHLRSSATTTVIVPPVRRSTLGDRSFPVTAPRAWNRLPSAVRASPSLITLRRELKTFLYHSSFVDC